MNGYALQVEIAFGYAFIAFVRVSSLSPSVNSFPYFGVKVAKDLFGADSSVVVGETFNYWVKVAYHCLG